MEDINLNSLINEKQNNNIVSLKSKIPSRTPKYSEI